jgi:uncharacterized protein (TIGR03435 family)
MVGIFAEGGQKVHMTARKQPVASFPNMLNGVYVVDDTGLTGAYDFKLEYQLAGLSLLFAKDFERRHSSELLDAYDADRDVPRPDPGSRETAWVEAGEAKAPFDVVVIDHIEKVPTEN